MLSTIVWVAQGALTVFLTNPLLRPSLNSDKIKTLNNGNSISEEDMQKALEKINARETLHI